MLSFQSVLCCDFAGQSRYRNVVTGVVMATLPPMLSEVTKIIPLSLDQDDDGLAVMPVYFHLEDASRLDLHHAVRQPGRPAAFGHCLPPGRFVPPMCHLC